jgi:hypothetical protein
MNSNIERKYFMITLLMAPGSRSRKVLMALCLFGFCAVSGLWAQSVPNLINYQGKLADKTGQPINGPVKIVFSVYALEAGGTALWTETQNPIYVNAGLFHVLLGAVNAMPPDLFNSPDRWIGVKVGNDAEIVPRSRIASVAYALRSGSTAAMDTWKSSGTTRLAITDAGNVGIGTTLPQSRLHVEGDVRVVGNVEIQSDLSVSNKILAALNRGLDLATRDGTTRLKIADNGNVGIGLTNPATLLHLKTTTGNTQAKLEAVNGSATLFLDGATGNESVEFRKQGVYAGGVGYGVFWGGLDQTSITVYTQDHTSDLQLRVRIWICQ